jgi:hypothetical protein
MKPTLPTIPAQVSAKVIQMASRKPVVAQARPVQLKRAA